MKELNKLEDMVAKWLKPLPHLPAAGQKWIATNVWWLELIGVVMLAFSAISLIGVLMMALGLSATFWGVAAFSGFAALSSGLTMLFYVASTVVMAMAISPLKALKKKGWDLLFLALAINAVNAVVGALVSFNPVTFITSILSGAIGVAIGAYFLFEIRSYFVAVKK